MDEGMVIRMKKDNPVCPVCGQLAAQMKKISGGSYRQYDQLLRKLMELERHGDMELYAGDCPLEDTDAVLDAEQHYTVCHYMALPQLRKPLFCGCLHSGQTDLSASCGY